MSFFDDLFSDGQRVLAILRGMPPERTAELARRAWDLGIGAVEVPIATPEAEESLRAAVRAGDGRPVGAGTVVEPEQVRTAARIGAWFTVAPGLDVDVVRAGEDLQLPHLPGVATPSEVQRASRLGMRWLKAFPATALGTEWFSAMRGPFPGIELVATGGIGARNAQEYLSAGASVVAVGSALEDPEQLPALAELVGRQ
jgi:2-dehydro-3-deoxyphosphogluconate aldolase/(4S)-4-hydroxy-2-oxoglutarate aldolase